MIGRLLLICYTAWTLAVLYGELSLGVPNLWRLFVLIVCPWLVFKVLCWGFRGRRRGRMMTYDPKSGSFR